MQGAVPFRQGRHEKLGYFLGLSILAHLLLALPPNRSLPHPLVQIPAPDLVLTAITHRTATPPSSRHIPSRRESTAAPAEMAQPHASQDDETTATSDAARANHLHSLLHAALDQHFIYPAFARRHGWEGRVDVLVHLDREGRLDAIRILHSSGYSILDEDALLTLQHIGTIPEARTWLRGFGYDMQLPILYRLTS